MWDMFLVTCVPIYNRPLEYSSINPDHTVFIRILKFCILVYVNYYVIMILTDTWWHIFTI